MNLARGMVVILHGGCYPLQSSLLQRESNCLNLCVSAPFFVRGVQLFLRRPREGELAGELAWLLLC